MCTLKGKDAHIQQNIGYVAHWSSSELELLSLQCIWTRNVIVFHDIPHMQPM